MARLISGQASENYDRVADADQVFDANGVPVRQTNAAVACCPADRLRIIRSVNADAGFVQAHPKHADEIVRSRWEIEIVFGADAIIQHSFIVTKPRPGRGALDYPSANRRRQRGRAGRDWKNTDEFVVLENFEQSFRRVDVDLARGEFRLRLHLLLSDLFDLERGHVWNFE